MFERLTPQPADKILGLSAAFRADLRSEKIDLGVGVYRNAEGITPIMRSVKAAERQLIDTQNSKSYIQITGDPAFSDAIANLVLGPHKAARRAAVATPGGTGALRQGFEFFRMAAPQASVWVCTPTWPNHPTMLRHVGVNMRPYRYFNEETCSVDFGAMMADLNEVQAGDAVLLHGCCHNPTGANLNIVQWQAVTELLLQKGALPLIDIAYQGFGAGLEADAAGLRLMARHVPEMLIAASCSKNFGIYRERTGCLIALCQNTSDQPVTQGTLTYLNRLNFSMPPAHGTALVTRVLSDSDLRADWERELDDMRQGLFDLRKALAEALRTETGSDRFGFIAEHQGMFSRLGLTPAQVDILREKDAIYMVGDSRMNIAGLTAKTVPIVARAVAQVSG